MGDQSLRFFVASVWEGGETSKCCCELAHDVIWFGGNILAILLLLDWQSEGVCIDVRSGQWDALVLGGCVLCADSLESRNHLFFSVPLGWLCGLPCCVGGDFGRLCWIGCGTWVRGGGLVSVSRGWCCVMLIISFGRKVIYGSMCTILGVWRWWLISFRATIFDCCRSWRGTDYSRGTIIFPWNWFIF